MGVQFHVLGEVEAYLDGRRLDVGHARQRCVLASLLVDVNHVVTADRLIDRVWTDEPPLRARNALASYVSRLRRALGEDGSVRIAQRSGAYTLETDAHAIDLHRFRQLVHQAHASTDRHQAAASFDEALALWGGEPFATLHTSWIERTRTSLEAERRSVLLERNDAALATGRHAELLGDLTALHHAHPLDERIAGQLMLSIYLSGSQAAALDVYRTIRARLVDELGVDPGPALRATHQSILAGTSTPVALPAGPSSARAFPEVRPVPRRQTTLVGRDDDIAGVTATLAVGSVVTLTGVGGVGKTRLALEIAHRRQHDFADGAWVCELAPVCHGSSVSHAVATALRLHQIQGRGIDDAVVDHLRSRNVLLVVDNCEHVLSDAAALLGRIARDCPGVTILATSREGLGVEGERVVAVRPLEQGAATELFVARAQASRPDFDLAREHAGAVAEICRRLDGVPLAIELAAARTRAMSTVDIARRLHGLRLLSGGSRSAHPRQQSVTATIDWSFQLLAQSEKDLFPRLSVFSGGFDLEAAHAVGAAGDATEDDTLDLLTGLVDKSMVMVRSTVGPTRYGVLETLRAYGRNLLDGRAIAGEVASRHARYYTGLVERAAVGMNGADEKAWVERLTPDAGATYAAPDIGNLRSAFETAMGACDLDLALRLVTSLHDLANRIGYYATGWAYRVIEVADRGHPLFPAAVGVAARAAWVLGDFSGARTLARMADGRVPGPNTGYLGHPDDVLADVALYQGNPSTALKHYERVLANSGTDTAPIRLVFILDRVTLCHQALGSSDAGLGAGRRALRVAAVTPNPTARSMARCALGRALADVEPERALTYLGEAAELAATVENNWLTGMARMEIAAIRSPTAEPTVAAQMFLALLDHWERGGPGTLAQQWDTLRLVAQLLRRLGDVEVAGALHRSLVRTGQRPPLGTADVACPGDVTTGILTGDDAVGLARRALQRLS